MQSGSQCSMGEGEACDHIGGMAHVTPVTWDYAGLGVPVHFQE